jgi:hypothetical protein
VRDLLLRHPNVVSLVSGHSHENQVTPYRRSGGTGGFWNVETASHIDFPQQSRTLEVMDNRDGTLSIFGTVLDHAAPVGAPPSGTTARRPRARTAAFSDLELSSIGRLLAANDPQRGGEGDGSGSRGARNDRNVELLVRDPRRLAAEARRRAARRSPRFTG